MEELLRGEEKTKYKAPLTWRALEHPHVEKNIEWFWALGLIGVAGAVATLMFGNVLFALFILVAVFVLALFASRKPEEVEFSLTQRGVRIDNNLYPYQALESFGIDEITPNHLPKLILEQKKTLALDIVIPLENVDPNEVHDYLFTFLPEEDHEEPLSHRIMEWLGF